MLSNILATKRPRLTPRLEQASRQRRILLGLLADHHCVIRQILALRWLLKGSVYQLKSCCGKPSCHCAAPQGLLHSTLVLILSQSGRTRLRVLRPEDRPGLCRAAEDYRRFRQCRAHLVKLHRQVLGSVDRLEKALRLPPPPPKRSRDRRRRGL
jgi:hypothetical protein